MPQDIAVVGFANEPFTICVDPPLNTVEQRGRLIGTRAAELLLDAPDGDKMPVAERTTVEATLVVRAGSQRSGSNG